MEIGKYLENNFLKNYQHADFENSIYTARVQRWFSINFQKENKINNNNNKTKNN